MKQSRFPKGWDEERVKRVLDHYENQTEDEAVAEDEAAWEDACQTFIEVPNELVPTVEHLLLDNHQANEGNMLIIVAGTPLAEGGRTNLLKLHRIGDPP